MEPGSSPKILDNILMISGYEDALHWWPYRLAWIMSEVTFKQYTMVNWASTYYIEDILLVSKLQ